MSNTPGKKPKAAHSTKAPAPGKQGAKASVTASNKSDAIRQLLERRGGASIGELSEVTGWQAHSVRGFLSGTLRKKLGLSLISTKDSGERRYRLEPGSERS